MTLKEMEAALEADWENVVAFFHGIFHKAEAVKEVAPASVAVEVPVAEPVPVAHVEEVKVDVPVNTTDATAPNFHAPAEPAPVAPVEAAPDWYAPVIDWSATGGGSSYNYKLHSSGSKTFTVPEGYVGFFTLSVGDDTESAGSAGYDTTLNGAHPYHAANGNNEITHFVYVGVVPPANNDPKNVVGGVGPYTYSVSCDGGAVIALRHYP